MRFLLIGCEVILRELCDAIAHSPHVVEPRFLHKGLHDRGARAMRTAIQQEIDAAEGAGYDALILGYGLCGNGLAGLVARGVPLVLPRAHDCITLLLGSRQDYENRFRSNPGVYYRSIGWLERGKDIEPLAQTQVGYGTTLDELIDKYGEDNGRYLFQELTGFQKNYSALGYIATGLECDGRFEADAQAEAASRGWDYQRIPGNLDLFRRLLSGDWDEQDFLIVPPGSTIKPCHDGSVVIAEINAENQGAQP